MQYVIAMKKGTKNYSAYVPVFLATFLQIRQLAKAKKPHMRMTEGEGLRRAIMYIVNVTNSQNKNWRMDNAHLLTPFITNWSCTIKAKKNNYKEARKP